MFYITNARRRNHSTHDDALEAGIWIRKDGESRHDDAKRSPLFPLSLWLDTITSWTTTKRSNNARPVVTSTTKWNFTAKWRGEKYRSKQRGFPLAKKKLATSFQSLVSQLKAARRWIHHFYDFTSRVFDMLILFRLKVTFCSFVGPVESF